MFKLPNWFAELPSGERIRAEVFSLCVFERLPQNFVVKLEMEGSVYLTQGLFPVDLEANPADVIAPFVKYLESQSGDLSLELHFGQQGLKQQLRVSTTRVGFTLSKQWVEERESSLWIERLEECSIILERKE